MLLKDENLPLQKWALGRIIKLYFGEDKRVRVVEVKTQSGVYKRPISKICIILCMYFFICVCDLMLLYYVYYYWCLHLKLI